jgi:hypothetical protein
MEHAISFVYSGQPANCSNGMPEFIMRNPKWTADGRQYNTIWQMVRGLSCGNRCTKYTINGNVTGPDGQAQELRFENFGYTVGGRKAGYPLTLFGDDRYTFEGHLNMVMCQAVAAVAPTEPVDVVVPVVPDNNSDSDSDSDSVGSTPFDLFAEEDEEEYDDE